MHILHIIESLEFGGAEKIVVDLANGFTNRARVSVCCFKTFGALRPTLAPTVEAFCFDKGEGNDYLVPVRLAREIRRRKIDVVHTHNWGTFVEGTLAAGYAGAAVRVHTVHGSYAKCGEGIVASGNRAVRHWVERRVASLCHRIVGVSDSICADIEREIGLSSSLLCTIHNGIEVNVPTKPRMSPRTRFVSVGRLAAIKNFPLMLSAFARLAGREHASLTIVGDGPERAHLMALSAQLGLGDRVHFVGFSYDVPRYLADADVFLVSSNYEGISIAVLEAMQAGLPVIATNVGGISETVVDGVTGMLIPAGDCEALTSAMAALVASRQTRQRMGSAGYALVVEKFSRQAMLDRYASLYRTFYPAPISV